MKRIHTTDGPEFLKHHFPLSEDRIAKLVLPVNLTRKEAERISDFLDALVLEPLKPKAMWPFADDDTNEEVDDNDFDEEDLETLDITEADLEWTEPEPASEPEPESTPQAHGQTQL